MDVTEPVSTIGTPPPNCGAGEKLWQASVALQNSGTGLMERILPKSGGPVAWHHYPDRDVVNGSWKARYYYHCHAPGNAPSAEHGHFHCFLARSAFSRAVPPLIKPPLHRKPRPALVHIAALSVGFDGVPLCWKATNRWVTDEWMMPSEAILAKIATISFAGEAGDPFVNDWLTAMLQASRSVLSPLLTHRDSVLAMCDPGGEDCAIETVSAISIDIDALVDGS